MTEYKFDPDKPGITQELFEQHQRNRARMVAGFKCPPDFTLAERGARGRASMTAWYEHAVFLAADTVSGYFIGAGVHHARATFDNYPHKTRLYQRVAQRVTEMLQTAPRPALLDPKEGEKPEDTLKRAGACVRKMLQRRRPLLEAIIQERIAEQTGPYPNPKAAAEDLTVIDAAAEILVRLNQPFRSPFDQD